MYGHKLKKILLEYGVGTATYDPISDGIKVGVNLFTTVGTYNRECKELGKIPNSMSLSRQGIITRIEKQLPLYTGNFDRFPILQKIMLEEKSMRNPTFAEQEKQPTQDWSKNPFDDKEKTMSKQLVRVLMIDNDKNILPQDSLIHASDEFMIGDNDDAKMFFLASVNVKELIDKHNERRSKLRDREACRLTGSDVMLEPIAISDVTFKVT